MRFFAASILLSCALVFSTGCTNADDDPTFVDLKQGRSAAEYNTQTLQHAINAASYQGGGDLRLPAGTFYFAWSHKDEWSNCAIIARSNVSISGEGMDQTFLKPLGSYDDQDGIEHGVDMFLHDGTDSGQYLVNADFSDFTIDGSAAHGDPEQYNSSGKGFSFTLFEDCDWNRVKVTDTDGTGFGVDFPVDCTMTDCIAVRCGKNATSSSYGASGFGIGTGYSEEESIAIENCTASDNTKYGFFFENQTTFDNPATTAKSAHGYVVRSCEASGNLYNFGGNRANDVRFVDCTSNVSASVARESYTRYAFQFHNYSTRVTVEGGEISQAFDDVAPEDACYEAVEWALARDIAEVGSEGYDTFRPRDNATRGEVAAFLWRYAGRPGEVVLGSHVELAAAKRLAQVLRRGGALDEGRRPYRGRPVQARRHRDLRRARRYPMALRRPAGNARKRSGRRRAIRHGRRRRSDRRAGETAFLLLCRRRPRMGIRMRHPSRRNLAAGLRASLHARRPYAHAARVRPRKKRLYAVGSVHPPVFAGNTASGHDERFFSHHSIESVSCQFLKRWSQIC
ncbi:MAG: S-layer homology domain-containing protein [Slackia sp.]